MMRTTISGGFRMRLGLAALGALLLVGATPAAAQMVLVDFDATPTADFEMATYEEDGATASVVAGHYEIVADALGAPGDLALNIDEQEHGLTTIRIATGFEFDVVQLEVVNPADAVGDFMITAVGGSGASIPAPTVAGTLVLGPDFQGITALEISQNQPGAFAIDDVELTIVPEPGLAASCAVLAVALAATRRRRA